MEFFGQTGAVLLVFALLGGAVYFLRTKRGFARVGDSSRRLQILERVALTPQHVLCLVRVGDREVMIATAPGNCQVLGPADGAKS